MQRGEERKEEARGDELKKKKKKKKKLERKRNKRAQRERERERERLVFSGREMFG